MTQGNIQFIAEESVTKLSIAVYLKDDFTGADPFGDVTISIKGIDKKPIKNLTGIYLFTDLPLKVNEAKVVVNSDYYLMVDKDMRSFSQDQNKPLFDEISLKPKSAYPFPVESTLVRAVVQKKTDPALVDQSSDYLPISDASVKAKVFQPETITTARVSNQDGAKKGDTTIQLERCSSSVKLNVGDVLMIEESNTDKMEFCQIAARLEESSDLETYNLMKSLEYDHSIGTPLFLMKDQNEELATRTNEKGEMVLYFKSIKFNTFLSDITISKEGYENAKLNTIEISEGMTKWLGVIKLFPNS